jgi:Fe2+ transport system protein B
MLLFNRSKSFFGGVSTIILMVALLILSGCGDSNAPGRAQQDRITKPVDSVFKNIGKTVLPSVEKTPDVK